MIDATQIDLVIELRRGSSLRVIFTLDDTVPDNFTNMFKNEEFKTDLNSSFSLPEILKTWSWQWDYCVTNGKFEEERVDGITSQIILCKQPNNTSLEETDTRVVLRISEMQCY